MGLYKIEAPMEQALAMADVLVKSCEQLAAALEHLRGFKDLEHYWIEIHRLENDGDRLYRDAVASLFANGIDPMVVIRWKDMFAVLERAVDATETAAHILEGIVIKNALGRPSIDRSRSDPGHRRRHGAGVRLHQRVSRHRQRRRDLDLDPGDVAAGRRHLRRDPNFVGAFISLEVAATVADDVVDAGAITTTVVFAGLVGAIAWNLRHLVLRPAVELLARADRRRGRRRRSPPREPTRSSVTGSSARS